MFDLIYTSQTGAIWVHGGRERLKSIFGQIQNGGRRQNYKCLNGNNSSTHCPILLVHYGPRDYNRERLVRRVTSSGNAALITIFSIVLASVVLNTHRLASCHIMGEHAVTATA